MSPSCKSKNTWPFADMSFSQSVVSNKHKQMRILSELWIFIQWQTDGRTDRQTDRKRCTWAHRAKCTGGLKNERSSRANLWKYHGMIRPVQFARPTSRTNDFDPQTCPFCPQQVSRTCLAISQLPLDPQKSMTYRFVSTFHDKSTLFQNSDDTTRWISLPQHLAKPLHTSRYISCKMTPRQHSPS